MKAKPSPFAFADHREFLRALLKEKDFSYRKFADRHGDVASFDLLASALSKGRTGTKSRPRRDFSAVTLARLGKTLGLSDLEVDQLLLLKLQNDAEVHPGQFGDAYVESLKRLARLARSRRDRKAESSATREFSELAEVVATLIEMTPATSVPAFARGILRESRVVLARNRSRPGGRAIARQVDRLAELANRERRVAPPATV